MLRELDIATVQAQIAECDQYRSGVCESVYSKWTTGYRKARVRSPQQVPSCHVLLHGKEVITDLPVYSP